MANYKLEVLTTHHLLDIGHDSENGGGVLCSGIKSSHDR